MNHNTLVPMIIKRSSEGERAIDLHSLLMDEGIILINGGVDSNMAGIVVGQLLHLHNEGKKNIQMWINSPGGSISDGMAIFNTMRYVKSDITTICTGMAASMGSFLLAAGTKGKRKAMPDSEIMVHQPLGSGGKMMQQSDIQINAKWMESQRDRLEKHLADFTGRTQEEVHVACDRDNWMWPEDALEFGLIDEIITHAPEKSVE